MLTPSEEVNVIAFVKSFCTSNFYSTNRNLCNSKILALPLRFDTSMFDCNIF